MTFLYSPQPAGSLLKEERTSQTGIIYINNYLSVRRQQRRRRLL